MSNWKAMIIILIAELMKKALYIMGQYFTKPYDRFGENVKDKSDLSNYAAKADIKGAREVDTSIIALKTNLSILKAEVDKTDVERVETFPVYSSKLGDIVNNEFVKKTVYDKLAAKVNNIDISRFVLKSKRDIDKSSQGKKINNADNICLIIVDFL